MTVLGVFRPALRSPLRRHLIGFSSHLIVLPDRLRPGGRPLEADGWNERGELYAPTTGLLLGVMEAADRLALCEAHIALSQHLLRGEAICWNGGTRYLVAELVPLAGDRV